jgi:hypothetical protein
VTASREAQNENDFEPGCRSDVGQAFQSVGSGDFPVASSSSLLAAAAAFTVDECAATVYFMLKPQKAGCK